jgi:hypothetical protein
MTVKPDGVAIDGRLLQASGKAKELFRYAVASLRGSGVHRGAFRGAAGRRIVELTGRPGSDRKEASQPVRGVLAGPTAFRMRLAGRKKEREQ